MKTTHRLLPVLAIAATSIAGAVTTAVVAAPAVASASAALCVTNSITGSWHNTDSNTRSVTRVVVTQGCDDVRRCDQYGRCTGGTGAFYDISVFGKCSPTDCAWGTRRLSDAGGGWYRTTYDFGFKTSTVWIKTSSYYGHTYLRVWVNNDFTAADGRADYVTDEWFLR